MTLNELIAQLCEKRRQYNIGRAKVYFIKQFGFSRSNELKGIAVIGLRTGGTP